MSRSDLRPWTLDERTTDGIRLHTKRCCEACGQPLGDTTDAELDAAMSGAPLPSVAEECGCVTIVAQLAMLNQRADASQNGTWPDGEMHPTWDEIDDAGQESYQAEALRTVRALGHLGWGPLARVLRQIGPTS